MSYDMTVKIISILRECDNLPNDNINITTNWISSGGSLEEWQIWKNGIKTKKWKAQRFLLGTQRPVMFVEVALELETSPPPPPKKFTDDKRWAKLVSFRTQRA